MDFFGIGQALMASFNIYFNTARNTGRTTNLVSSLESGDRVICANENDKRDLVRLINQRGIEVDIIVLSPENWDVSALGTSVKRTVFDHRFIELYHVASLKWSVQRLNDLEQRLSGENFRHRESREAVKWRRYCDPSQM